MSLAIGIAEFLYFIDFHCAVLVSPCCHRGDLCVALAFVLNAPVTAASVLLSRPPVVKSHSDVKHLDGSLSPSGYSFTRIHTTISTLVNKVEAPEVLMRTKQEYQQ